MTEVPSEQKRIEQRNKELQELGATGKSSVFASRRENLLYRCPCCYYKTLGERGGYDICPVCFWEDDGQDDNDAESVWGGPNYSLSLTKARQNYREIGACEERVVKFVRPPLAEEW